MFSVKPFLEYLSLQSMHVQIGYPKMKAELFILQKTECTE